MTIRISHLSESKEGICYMMYIEQENNIDFSCNFGLDEVEALKNLPDIGNISIELLEIEKWKENGKDTYKIYETKDFRDVKTYKELVKKIVDITQDLSERDQFYINGFNVKGNYFRIDIKDYFINIVFNSEYYRDFSIAYLIKWCLQFDEKIAEKIWNTLKDNQSKYIIVDYKGRILEIWDKSQFDWEKFSSIKPENY